MNTSPLLYKLVKLFIAVLSFNYIQQAYSLPIAGIGATIAAPKSPAGLAIVAVIAPALAFMQLNPVSAGPIEGQISGLQLTRGGKITACPSKNCLIPPEQAEKNQKIIIEAILNQAQIEYTQKLNDGIEQEIAYNDTINLITLAIRILQQLPVTYVYYVGFEWIARHVQFSSIAPLIGFKDLSNLWGNANSDFRTRFDAWVTQPKTCTDEQMVQAVSQIITFILQQDLIQVPQQSRSNLMTLMGYLTTAAENTPLVASESPVAYKPLAVFASANGNSNNKPADGTLKVIGFAALVDSLYNLIIIFTHKTPSATFKQLPQTITFDNPPTQSSDDHLFKRKLRNVRKAQIYARGGKIRYQAKYIGATKTLEYGKLTFKGKIVKEPEPECSIAPQDIINYLKSNNQDDSDDDYTTNNSTPVRNAQELWDDEI